MQTKQLTNSLTRRAREEVMIALPNDAETDSETRGYHLPVLLREVLDYLRPGPDEIFLDCTIGGGGPAPPFLRAGAAGISVGQAPAGIAARTPTPGDSTS